MEFEYNRASESRLLKLLSNERLATYLTVSRNVLSAALELYVWNCAVSAALYGPLQAVEVALRNSFSEALCSVIGPDWTQDSAFLSLDNALARDIHEAEARVIRAWVNRNIAAGTARSAVSSLRAALLRQAYAPGSGVITTSRTVADLTFGFWIKLLRPQFQVSLYGPVLSRAFAVSIRRKELIRRLEPLHQLRNRIAHHEAIHRWNLAQAYDDLLVVAGWIDPELRSWVEYHSRCRLLISDRPRQRQQF